MEAHPEVSFSEATVSAAEVHMLLLGVRMNWDEHDPFYFAGPLIDSPDTTARNEAAEALREDPGHPLATYLAGGLRKKPSPEQMRKTTVTHPSDWRAFYLLASALDADTQRGAREAALREALRLNPDSAAANNAFAWSLVTHGQAKEALPFARRAFELAPASAQIVDTLAAVAFGLQACPRRLQWRSARSRCSRKGKAIRCASG